MNATHSKSVSLVLLTLVVGLAPSALAQESEFHFDGAEELVYKEVDGAVLKLHVFKPNDHSASDTRAAIVFFFGGGWRGGTPAQFEPHCRELANKGMVAITAEYRVRSRHGNPPIECVKDAFDAMTWVRSHARELGVDPDRIAAGGGSAGGHLAACTGVITSLDTSSGKGRANALVLYNPALDLSAVSSRSRWGDDALKASPNQHISKGEPPAIVFHGTGDTTVPFAQAEDFAAKMKAQGNRCELKPYEGRAHGFFNKARGDGSDYVKTLGETVVFLESLGYIEE